MKKILIGAAALTILAFATILIVNASSSANETKNANTEVVKEHSCCSSASTCHGDKAEAKADCGKSCDNCTCGGTCDPAKCAGSCDHAHAKVENETSKGCCSKM